MKLPCRLLLVIALAGSLLLSIAVSPVYANEHLLNKIAMAQERLNRIEQRVSKERQLLVRQLNQLEREVLELREKTAVARRLDDEKTLSLSQLEERLESWQQQQVYQRNLLHRFLQRQGGGEISTAASTSGQIAWVVDYSNRIEGFLFPTWQPRQLTLINGRIETLPTLSVGPITLFWNPETERAGLASDREGGHLQADVMLSAGDSDAVSPLREGDSGALVFDPTMSRALAKQQHAESVVEHVTKGGLWVIPILFFALFALSIALLKVVQLWRLPAVVRFTPGVLESAFVDARSRVAVEVRGMQRTLLEIAQRSTSERRREDQLFMQLQDDRHYLDRWIGVIAITASVAPLLGLLGTVSGMIETFKMMTLFGSGDPEVVSGGIAQALVTTELGLVVAIPALILNAVLSRRAKSYYNELESFAILMSKATESATEEGVRHA